MTYDEIHKAKVIRWKIATRLLRSAQKQMMLLNEEIHQYEETLGDLDDDIAEEMETEGTNAIVLAEDIRQLVDWD